MYICTYLSMLCVWMVQVIYTLTHKVSLTHTEAVALATYVDRKVRM